MVSGPARPLVCACLLIGPVAPAVADGPAPAPRRAPAKAAPAQARPAQPSPVATAALARAEAEGRIKELPASEKDLTADQKALREAWTERLALIDEWEKAAKAHHDADNPQPSPEREVAKLRAELDQRKAMIEQLANSPETILIELFRIPPEQVDDAKLVEMSKEIEHVRDSLADRTTELEKRKAKVEPATRASLMRDRGLERDRAHARKAALTTLRATLDAAYKSATTDEARLVARERLVNFQWEKVVADEWLASAEATLTTELRRGEALDLAVKSQDAYVTFTQALLATISKRYAVVAELKKASLRAEASREQERASKSDDPVEKFRARRMAEILRLKAQVVEYERMFSANPGLSIEDQKAQADHADRDFASLKAVVSENRVGGLVALRLNNDFRRLSRERSMVQRNELADSAAAHAHYENALTEAELSYINDDRDDRFERDAFIETLPASRRAEAGRAIEAIEKQHRDLLIQRKDVLERLLERAETVHAQVARRLRILDEQYAFIRTHIFWVRDSEPLGESTLVQGRRDAARLASAVVKLGTETVDPAAWGHVSAEFGLILAGLIVLPPAIVYARRRLKARIAAPRIIGPVVHII